MVSDAKKKANKKYDSTHYKNINLKIKNERKDLIDEIAKNQNMPVATFCRLCIDYCIDNNIDLTDDKTE